MAPVTHQYGACLAPLVLPPVTTPLHPIVAKFIDEASLRGFNLVGFVGQAEFDDSQPPGRRAADLAPRCGTILLLGNGGAGYWDRMTKRVPGLREPAPDYHPVDADCAEMCAELIRWLGARGVEAAATFPDDPAPLNFLHLAEMSGWGTISPVIGILLHPEFGSWVSTRAALLLSGDPFGVVNGEEHQPFQPCLGCSKPCVDACPADVFDGAGGIDLEACARHRVAGNCQHGCDARRACPVGAEERYGPVEERHRHAYSLFSMRRHFDL